MAETKIEPGLTAEQWEQHGDFWLNQPRMLASPLRIHCGFFVVSGTALNFRRAQSKIDHIRDAMREAQKVRLPREET